MLESHPDINAVAVIGVFDEALGERVKAFIEPLENGRLTGEMVKEYLKDKVAKYKVPEFIEIVETLPRNPTGKILKYELRKKD